MEKSQLKNPEFSQKRQCYASKIDESGKRPTNPQIRQAYLSNLEDGRFLESIQKNWKSSENIFLPK